MSDNTKISWGDATWNPVWGCTPVSPGCDHCYAETRNARYGGGVAPNWGPGAPRRRTSESNWKKPYAWNRAHDKFFTANGRRQTVFCASLADVMDNAVPDSWRFDLATVILDTPNLIYLLLTKRVGNAHAMLLDMFPNGIPENVRLGITVVNQEESSRDLPKLLMVKKELNVRAVFLSIEPMLGPISLARDEGRFWFANWLTGLWKPKDGSKGDGPSATKIDWVICGGESGADARPMNPGWVKDLRDECAEAGTPFLFKQWGEWAPVVKPAPLAPGDEWVDYYAGKAPAGAFSVTAMRRVGKKAAGRLLDGVTHDGFPT